MVVSSKQLGRAIYQTQFDFLGPGDVGKRRRTQSRRELGDCRKVAREQPSYRDMVGIAVPPVSALRFLVSQADFGFLIDESAKAVFYRRDG